MSAPSSIKRPALVIPAAIALVVALVWWIAAARANQPLTLDQRVKEVASQVQVPGGFGDSAATSSLPVAQEMRDLIRQDLSEGMSEQQILDYFRQRYGDDILEAPPTAGFNALMWFPPVLLATIALYFAWRALRVRRPGTSTSTPAATGNAPSTGLESYRQILRREIAANEGFGAMSERGRD